MTTPAKKSRRAMWTCQLTTAEVVAIPSNLAAKDSEARVPSVVAELRRETGCSRATAYQAVSDALAAGEVTRGAHLNHRAGSCAAPCPSEGSRFQ